LATIFILPQKV